jgi:tetratricopeptide (TPR) repeat protein
MTAKRSLGLGLDTLLTAMQDQQKAKLSQGVIGRVQLLYDQALEQEKTGDIYEAYYLYRQAVDLIEPGIPDETETAELISRCCNNLAVILFEGGKTEKAAAYLQRAIDLYPRNRTAAANLKLL